MMKFNVFKKIVSIILSFTLFFGIMFYIIEKNHNLNINNQNITTNSLIDEENFSLPHIKDVSIPPEKINHDGFDVKLTFYDGSWYGMAVGSLLVQSNDASKNGFNNVVARSENFTMPDSETLTKHVIFSSKLSQDVITYNNLIFSAEASGSTPFPFQSELSVTRPEKKPFTGNLTTPNEGDIHDATSSSIKIDTTVSPSTKMLKMNEPTSDYVLRVENKNGDKIGTNPDVVLNTYGLKTIELTGLNSGQTYNDSKICAYLPSDVGGRVYAQTDSSFSFSTLKKTVGHLSNPTVESIGEDVATIKTDVSEASSPSSSNGEFEDYTLEVHDSSGSSLGSTTTLSDGGTQSISLSGLTPNKIYSNNTVVALSVETNVILATSINFDFTTTAKVVGHLSQPTISSVSKTEATVKTDVSEGSSPSSSNGEFEDYTLEVHDSSGSSLGSTTTLSDGGTQSISLSGLTPNKIYSNNTVVALSVSDGTTLATSPEFEFTTSNRIIEGISDSSIDSSNPPTENSFFINLTTSISSDDHKTDTFKAYNIVVTANHGSLTDDTIFTSSNQTDFKDNASIAVTGLTGLTKYSNIKVKLIDSETLNILGSEFSIVGEVTTTGKVELNINNATIVNPTEDGFKFTIDTSSLSGGDSFDYKIDVLSGDENTLIWSSKEYTELLDEDLKPPLEVTGLEKSTIYSSIKFQLVNPNDDTDKYSDIFSTDIDITPTNNIIRAIDKDSAKVTKINKTSFEFSIDVNGTHPEEEYSSPYKIAVFINGDTTTPIWMSDELLKSGKNITFTIDGFDPGQKLENIQLSLINVNTNKPSGNFSKLADQITMKPSIGMGDKFFAFMILFFTIIIVLAIIKRTFFKKGLRWKYWWKKILRQEYIIPVNENSSTEEKKLNAKIKPKKK